jgi:predicted secreted protein
LIFIYFVSFYQACPEHLSELGPILKSEAGQGLPCFIRPCPEAQQLRGKRNEEAKRTFAEQKQRFTFLFNLTLFIFQI